MACVTTAAIFACRFTANRTASARKTGPSSLSQPAKKGKTSLVFDDIPPGRYALMAYHDANGDNKLNLRFGMFPLEGYALSNNPQVIGPPRFNDSAFDFPAADGAPINLQIKY